MRRLAAFALLLLALLLPAPAGSAEAPDRVLTVGTKEAPPFAMKAKDGTWQGVSIDLWRQLAEQTGFKYRLVEKASVQDLVDGLAANELDAAVAAITITAGRQKVIDFTQPFYVTGLGVAVSTSASARWLPVIRTFLSARFLQAVLILLAIALTVGVLIWLFERRENKPYGGGAVRGLTAGVWWSAVAMTQAGAAQDGPTSLPGRILAVIWMVASIISLAVFTAGITSALTTREIHGLVHNLDDLRALRVGAVQGSSTEDFFRAERISLRGFADAQAGLQALQKNQIDAFVYDKPILRWIVRQNFTDLEVLSITFDPQTYGIGLPAGSTLRVPIDIALLDALRSEWWKDVQFRYLGQPDAEQEH